MIGGYIIKPDAFEHRNEIRKILSNSGLNIIKFKTWIFTKSEVESLYPKLDNKMIEIAIKHLTSGKSEIGLIEGKEVFQVLLQIGGHSTSPDECEENTIRYIFGQHEPILVGNYQYFLNAFHRTKNEEQTQFIKKLLYKHSKHYFQ